MSKRDDKRPKPIEEFHAAVGQFVLEWAGLELCLDLLLLKIRLRHDEANRPERLPHQLEGKIKCIRSLTDSLGTSISAHRAAICDLLNKIEDHAETRHAYVHGAVINHYIDRGIVTVTLARMLQPRKKPRQKPVKATPAEIRKTSGLIHEFGNRLLDIMEALDEQPSSS